MTGSPLLALSGVVKSFVRPGAAERILAVNGVDLAVGRGEWVGLIGHSGSGKSTLARIALGLLVPDRGSVSVDGRDLAGLRGAALRAARRRLQPVFQDPFASLDPRMTAEAIVGEGLPAAPDRTERVRALARRVGIDPEHLGRFPHRFSAGQRQRLALARALAVGPDLLVLDEPVSSLDTVVQARILDLLLGIKAEGAVSGLFISHDLAVVAAVAGRILVMEKGAMVETGTPDSLVRDPRHPATRRIVDATRFLSASLPARHGQ